MPELFNHYLKNDANLQGYWRMENDWNDSSVNAYHLTPTNSPTFTAGKFNLAGNFASVSSQYASIADVSCPNLEISGNQTLALWFKPTTIALMNLIGKNGATNQHQLYMDADGKINSNFSGLSVAGNTHPLILVAAQWYFIVFTYDGTNTKIYVDNVVNSVAATGTTNDTNSPFYFGRDNSGTYLNGVIDDVAVWNRALSANEVKSIYNNYQRGPNYLSSTSENGISVTERYR